jgi:PKD domain
MQWGKGLLVAGALVALAFPASAGAATFYAATGGGNVAGCPQATPCSLPNAITQATMAGGHDAVQVVGPLDFTGTIALEPGAGTPGIDLIGSGQGAGGTRIRATANHSQVIDVGATSSIRNLRAVSANDEMIVIGDIVVRLLSGADATDVTAASEHPGEDTGFSMSAGPGESVLDRVTADPGLFQGSGLGTGSLEIRDSQITGQTAFLHVIGGTARILRTTLRGEIGISHSGGPLTVSSSVLDVTSTGTYVSGGAPGPVELRNVTVLGDGDGNGVWSSGSPPVTVVGSIVRGFAPDLLQSGGGVLSAGTSDFSTKMGTITDLGGNVDVDPRFVNRATGDLRLQPQSVVIDAAGGQPPAAGESPFDRIGTARLVDGNGDGSALRDMGAFEYRPPGAVLDVPNPSPTQDEAVAFDASRSAYAEAAISDFQFDLDGDGVFETVGAGPRVSRAYSAAGPRTVRLRVLGADGGAATTAVTLTVRDVRLPVLDRVSLTNRAFLPTSRPTALVTARRRRSPRGTTFRYRLSETATMRIAIAQARPGRRVGRRCLAPTRARRRRPRCTRYVTRGTLVRRNLAAGARRTPFSGRLGRRKLPAARYRARLQATDLAGLRSRTRTLFFRVLAR